MTKPFVRYLVSASRCDASMRFHAAIERSRHTA